MESSRKIRTGYDPIRHHRRSIRLESHDYAGGGVYFVTICAHREFIRWANGNPFGAHPASHMPVPPATVSAPAVGARPASPSLKGATQVSPGKEGATQVSPVRGLIEARMRITAQKCPFMQWGAAVIMPDHLHALIRLQGAVGATLGHVIGGFKAAVSRELRRIPGFLPSNARIWHRNYYERIVRTPEAETHIADYIRLNPWKLVQHAVYEGQSFRMIGNPALLNREKIAVLCSRNCPPEAMRKAEAHVRRADARHCFIGGFHSPPERALLAALLRAGDMNVVKEGDTGVAPTVICCPAWGIDAMRIPPDWIPALETNRLLILEMRNRDGDLAAAEQRNRFVLQCAEKRWIPHVAPGGMLDRLIHTHGRHSCCPPYRTAP